VGVSQGIDGKYALVIGMPIGTVDVLQGTDGKYTLVIGIPIGIVDSSQGTDGKSALGAFSWYCIFSSLHSPVFAHAHPVLSRWSAHEYR